MAGIAFCPTPVFFCKAASGLKTPVLNCPCCHSWFVPSAVEPHPCPPCQEQDFAKANFQWCSPEATEKIFWDVWMREGWKELSAARPQGVTESWSALSQWRAPWGDIPRKTRSSPMIPYQLWGEILQGAGNNWSCSWVIPAAWEYGAPEPEQCPALCPSPRVIIWDVLRGESSRSSSSAPLASLSCSTGRWKLGN